MLFDSSAFSAVITARTPGHFLCLRLAAGRWLVDQVRGGEYAGDEIAQRSCWGEKARGRLCIASAAMEMEEAACVSR